LRCTRAYCMRQFLKRNSSRTIEIINELTMDEKESLELLKLPQKKILDDVGILTESERNEISIELDLITQDTGAEVAVLSWDRTAEDQKAAWRLATAVFDKWGVGKAHDNNGLLIVLFRKSRRLQFRTGEGTKTVIDDGFLTELAESLAPLFADEKYKQALSQAIGHIGQKLRARSPYTWLYGKELWQFLLPLLALGTALVIIQYIQDQRRKKCPECFETYVDAPLDAPLANVYDLAVANEMTGSKPLILENSDEFRTVTTRTNPKNELAVVRRRKSDNALVVILKDGSERQLLTEFPSDIPDDCFLDQLSGNLYAADPMASRLSPCQLLERRLGAVSFRHVKCPKCESTTLLPLIPYFSRYELCPHCGCRAATEKLVATSIASLERASEIHHYRRSCAFCHKSDDWSALVPRSYSFEFSSNGSENSSKGSSSSTFGGGNSKNGGGAGTSW